MDEELDPKSKSNVGRGREIAAQYWNLASQHGSGQAAKLVAEQYGLQPAEVLEIAAEFPEGREQSDKDPPAKDPQPGD